MAIKERFYQFYHWEYFWLYLLVIATLAMHFSIINNPSQLILDEQHYVNDARNIISNHTDLRPEHPPLAKLFVVAGIQLFGDDPLGWRFFSIIFGTILIILFFFVCRKLGMSRNAVNIATFLFALDNFTFVQASVAMLDVYFVTFMMLSFLLYLNREYFLSGVSLGLSALCKLDGAMAAPVIFIHWLFSRTRRSWRFLLTVILAPLSFVALMPLFDYAINHRFLNPFDRIKEMLSLSGSLTFANTTHPALSRPWQWVLTYDPMAYWYTPHYTGGINPTIWVLIIPASIYMIYRAVKGNEAGLFGIAWFFSTYILWIPMSLITNRISFVYYFYPTIGAICLGIGLGLAKLIDLSRHWRSNKLRLAAIYGIGVYLALHVISFLILSPLTNWINPGIKG